MTYQKENPNTYRYNAIALVYLDKIEDASKVLEETASIGMNQVEVNMVKGEIARITENYQEAFI